ncbi:PLP-dependent aminotransferase family protein [Actinopolymorpha sp. NPDC004070]|uniref:MocR-like pyridoxine biosynthesis transcription factor PdxR n=1 Tax=Actinopolymorpha sp. NPDC004070 TaxID=3154548 RepID=UPI00339DD336
MSTEWSSTQARPPSDGGPSLDLVLHLDRSQGLRHGLEAALREAIRSGRLRVGTSLPSTRTLAADLEVARGTVTAAYAQLTAEGYLAARQGAPTRVRWRPDVLASEEAGGDPVPTERWDLRAGWPDPASFPRQAWAAATRRVLRGAATGAFGYGDPFGHLHLRRALAGYLGRAREVRTRPDRMLVCSGYTQALDLLCRVLRSRGAKAVAMEDPCAPRYRRIAEAAGLRVVAVPCDDDGLRVDVLRGLDVAAVVTTPAHQYPLGVTLAPARRTRLVDWAGRTGAIVVEDDYDGEFRYDRQPVGAVQALDPDRVVYVGTASKTLSPALRLGWLALPGWLVEPLGEAKSLADRGSGVLDQLVLADLIERGDLDRHLRLLRQSYRRRRDLLVAGLRERGGPPPTGIAAGLHAVVPLDLGRTESDVLARARSLGIALNGLGDYWYDPGRVREQALVVGYGAPAGSAYQPTLSRFLDLWSGDDDARGRPRR